MRIALDMMGGDYAPKQSCLGVISFLQKYQDVTIVALGNAKDIYEYITAEYPSNLLEIINAPEIIGMHEHPIRAIKEKPNSSLNIGFKMLSQGEIDILISAGNTGVMLVGAAQIIKPIAGVLRPTIPSPIPQIDGGYAVMLDMGINADCKPENLNQFATLGSIYCKEIYGVESPKVALLNIGEEEGKGNILSQATYPLLKQNADINFVGNIEGRDILLHKADVIVTDGFTGNIVLKFAESLYDTVMIKRNIKDEYLEKFNHKLYAGVPVLGINKPLIVGHGVSDEHSFVGMLELARKMLTTKMNEKIVSSFVV